jgi:hypothetical protein
MAHYMKQRCDSRPDYVMIADYLEYEGINLELLAQTTGSNGSAGDAPGSREGSRAGQGVHRFFSSPVNRAMTVYHCDGSERRGRRTDGGKA